MGLLKPSFRPQGTVCALRALSRHRAGLVDSAAVHIQHMHKALTQMNLQIHHVLADITGLSGMAILEAIVLRLHKRLCRQAHLLGLQLVPIRS